MVRPASKLNNVLAAKFKRNMQWRKSNIARLTYYSLNFVMITLRSILTEMHIRTNKIYCAYKCKFTKKKTESRTYLWGIIGVNSHHTHWRIYPIDWEENYSGCITHFFYQYFLLIGNPFGMLPYELPLTNVWKICKVLYTVHHCSKGRRLIYTLWCLQCFIFPNYAESFCLIILSS